MRISFLKSDCPPPSFNLNGHDLKCVNHIKLLGVTLQDNLKWEMHIHDIVAKACRRLYTLIILKKAKAPSKDLLQVYTCYIRPLVEYACPVWHSSITKDQTKSIERIQKRALRIIYGMNYVSYESALKLSDLPSLVNRRVQLLLKFGKGIIKSDTFRSILPPVRDISRTLRSASKPLLKIPFGRTERFRSSPVPFLVRLINDEY
ncbi:uncharacterized protein [Antedon mediterranea]|uniref:uncharacterized protein n=1 Tax=Antedon mediterranea TaxID=105859 RepID=UPI003AF768DC